MCMGMTEEDQDQTEEARTKRINEAKEYGSNANIMDTFRRNIQQNKEGNVMPDYINPNAGKNYRESVKNPEWDNLLD